MKKKSIKEKKDEIRLRLSAILVATKRKKEEIEADTLERKVRQAQIAARKAALNDWPKILEEMHEAVLNVSGHRTRASVVVTYDLPKIACGAEWLFISNPVFNGYCSAYEGVVRELLPDGFEIDYDQTSILPLYSAFSINW